MSVRYKKALSFFFIVLVAANFLAPFSININKGTPAIQKNVAEAVDLSVARSFTATDSSITLTVTTRRKVSAWHKVWMVVSDARPTTLGTFQHDGKEMSVRDAAIANHSGATAVEAMTAQQIFKLAPSTAFTYYPEEITLGDNQGETDEQGTPYWVKTKTYSITGLKPNTQYFLNVWGYSGTEGSGNGLAAYAVMNTEGLNIEMKTAEAGKTIGQTNIGTSGASDDPMPECGIGWLTGGGTLGGCIAQILYYLLFVPTSFIFELTGKFFDFTFYYSVNDGSYRSAFVEEGWATVRDFVNMFFIFVLLYIAFATILSLHGFKTKEMIINVVIIGLLINFSLFATRLIIDTSNILARVFYNTNTLITGDKDANNQIISKLGVNKEIQLSGAIVNKVDPQTLILKARSVKAGVTDKGGTLDGSGLGTSGIILVILLATAVNVIGSIVFLMVGIIFVARVIGLWLAMIFVPFAFFSYTVPKMKGIDMLGWEKWWPNTLKLAFLAPIFIFFLYLILKFLNMDSIIDVVDKTGKEKEGVDFVISVIIPFAFIIVLLNTAKKLAVKFSGDVGAAVTNAAKKAGGLAVGAAALGAGAAAAVGRGLITNPLKMMQSSQATRSAAIKNFSVLKPASWGKAMSAKMANVTIGKSKTITNPDGTKTTKEGSNKLRDRLLSVKARKAEKTHAAHTLDEEAEKVSGRKGAKYSELDTNEQKKVKDQVTKDEVSKALFNKPSNKLDMMQLATLSKVVDTNGNVDRSQLDTTARSLGKDISKFYDKTTGVVHDGNHIENTYNKPNNDHVGNALAFAANGTYDVRNMKSGGLTALGIAAALTGVAPIIGAAMAAHSSGALRLGLKKAFKTDIGTSQKDFFKDLKSALSETLKHMKVDVKVDGDGHGSGTASGDGGGGGHH